MRNIDYVVYVAKYYKTETESAWYRVILLDEVLIRILLCLEKNANIGRALLAADSHKFSFSVELISLYAILCMLSI